AHSKLADSCQDHVQRRPARLEYNSEHKSSSSVAVFQTPAHERRQRTSEDSLPVESIPNQERNRIRGTKIRKAVRRKIRYTCRIRLKPGHGLHEAIAAGGLAANQVLPRWR